MTTLRTERLLLRQFQESDLVGLRHGQKYNQYAGLI